MIPKHIRRASESHSHETRSYDTTSAAMPTNTLHYDTRSLQMPSPMQSMPTSSAAYGYTLPPSSTLPVSMSPQAASLSQAAATYDPFAVQGPGILPPGAVESPVSHRASSGAWTPADDNTLLQARAQGLNWSQIQNNYFPSKTSNACRKRHERLMERRGQDDFDARRMERLAREYMGMRREIWQGLAARTGEKWNVVEARCMSSGLKNLQSASRAGARRERLESGPPPSSSSSSNPYGDDGDSGISGIGLTPGAVDDLDGAYRTADEGGDESDPWGVAVTATATAIMSSHHHHHHHLHHQHSHHSHSSHKATSYHSSPGSHNGSVSTTTSAAGYPATAAEGMGMTASGIGVAGMNGGMGGSYGYPAVAAHHGYTSSVSSTGTNAGYGHGQSGPGQAAAGPYTQGGRLSSVDMGISSIINRSVGESEM